MSSAPKLQENTAAFKCFDVEIADNIAHIRLNRPDAFNSMIREFWHELPEIIKDIDDNARARAIVISGEGKHFCAGMDLAVFAAGNSDDLTGERSINRRINLMRGLAPLQQTFSCLDEARMPVLVAIQGACVGGAIDFISACDMRYCSKDAFFCIQEINIGMTADVGTFPRLPHLMPQGLVRELAFSGRRMHAEEALRVGFVNEVFETHDDMLKRVLDIAAEIAQKAPIAVWGSKEMINYARDHSIADGLKHIATWQAGMFSPPDMQESFSAKQEKRKTQFENLPKKPKPI